MSAPPSSTPSDHEPKPTTVSSGDGAPSLPDPETKRAKTEGLWGKVVKPGLDVVTLAVSLTGLIPQLADQNRCAQPHAPMNIVRQS